MSCYEEGFRLADAASECSMRSKARIDTLFEDTRSICSSMINGLDRSLMNDEEIGSEEQIKANGAVQARIEAMFASVEAETGIPGKSAAAILPVKYLGAAAVGGRVASVRGLQEPLRQLLERVDDAMSAELEISRRGLTYRTSELWEKTNPFRRIAVWSALRLHGKTSESGERSQAFLPLVRTDESIGEKEAWQEKHADLYRSMRDLSRETEDYPPIFAVVMRRPGAARLLECHAFACRTEEEAIAAAATLYRALLTDLDANRRRPRQSNGLGCVSLASVASSVATPSILGPRSLFGPNSRPSSRISPSPPIRPPRSKKNSLSSCSQLDRVSLRSSKHEKPGNKKKKSSDTKAEDILEARSRKSANSRIIGTGKGVAPAIPKNHDGATILSIDGSDHKKNKSRNCRSRNEERNNLRNKIVDREAKSPSNAEKMPKEICTENDLYSGQPRVYNNYEKMPKRVGSTNSREKVEADYREIQQLKSIAGDSVIDDREDYYSRNNRTASYREIDTVRNSKSRDSTGSQASSSRGNAQNRSRSRKNSISTNEEKHVAEQRANVQGQVKVIGDLESTPRRASQWNRDEEILAGTRRGNSLESRSGLRIEDRKNWSVGHTQNCQNSGRSSRLDTMLVATVASKENTPLSSKDHDPKVRKRARAGSEPPFGRTEDLMKNPQNPKLKRSQSDLEVDRGDPMTRVELPRRGSFLKPANTRLPTMVNGGTPLGFTELFDEFRNQEGLTSVDDILAAIIDPEGMSFNDLKPLYKEFLLKLAATLTQDELYQRSASIMRRRRRPQRRRSVRKPCLLGRAIKRSVSRLKGNGPTEFTSVIFPAGKLNDSFDSSSSCDARNNGKRVLAGRLARRRPSWRNSKCHPAALAASEDSDTCRRLARSAVAGANRSSSGYVSCSECSYDSESCTCVSADKCYCSLSRRAPGDSGRSTNARVCGCDTDSCSDSNKCYCARRASAGAPSILEQLRQRGIVPSESSLSRAASPLARAKTKSRTSRGHAASKSLEFHKVRKSEVEQAVLKPEREGKEAFYQDDNLSFAVKIRPSPGRSSSDNLALDYDLFSPGKKSQASSVASEKVLVVSARDPQGRLVYVGGSERDKKPFDRCLDHNGLHHEALSIKKSAEIAAVFGPNSIRSCRRAGSISSARSSVSLEAGLGYLP